MASTESLLGNHSTGLFLEADVVELEALAFRANFKGLVVRLSVLIRSSFGASFKRCHVRGHLTRLPLQQPPSSSGYPSAKTSSKIVMKSWSMSLVTLVFH